MPEYQRHAAGTPASMGGKFKTHGRAEADVDLGFDPDPADAHVSPSREQWNNRIKRLMSHGFVPPAALDAEKHDTSSRRGAIREDVREDWWGRQHAVSERHNAAGDYAQMPDDNTPGMTLGKSSSGHRRTHRMNYRGSGVSLRMPSATAIKRFSEQSGQRTFDVPVTAEYPGGSVQGWVRVTRGDNGTWGTQGLNFNSRDDAYVAEGVRCVLEGKRPTHALAEAGDLIGRRRERQVAEGTELRPANPSGWVAKVGRDEETGTTVITTKSGGKAYGWATSRAAFIQLAESKAPGKVVNEMKRFAQGREMSQCPKCSRVHAADTVHRCRVQQAGRDGGRHEANERTLSRGIRAAFRRRGR